MSIALALSRTAAFVALLNARADYVYGRISLDEFERVAERCVAAGA